ARVREVLGLISDDVYGELLRLVSERDPKAVFPLVERLVDAGADLGEFVAGAGEIMRAVLLANLGGKPEGLTEPMQELLGKYRSLLPAPDLVRLLAALTELEPQLRSSGNARLAVELLLLRWAMMSRTVEIGQVLEALGMRQPGSGMRDAGSGPATPPVLRDTSSGAPATPPASRIPHPDPPEKGPLTLDRLRALWPRIVDDARTKSPMLGALLQFRLSEIQSQLAQQTVTCTAGGGIVAATADGRGQIRAIKIDPQAIAQGDVEMLEDLVLAAVSQAQQRAAELYQAEVKKLASG